MPLMKWNESMSVNIEEIDHQHQELVAIINSLFDAMKVAKGFDVLDVVIDKLVNYVHYHFETEEKYFDKFEYSESQLHKNEHRKFSEQIYEARKAFNEGKLTKSEEGTPLTVELWKLLKDWFINHVMIFDKKYAPLFKENGLK